MRDIQLLLLKSLERISRCTIIPPQELLDQVNLCINIHQGTLKNLYLPRKYEILFHAVSTPLFTQTSSRKDGRYWECILNIFKIVHNHYFSFPHIERQWFQRVLHGFPLLRLISELFGELLEGKETKYDCIHEHNIEHLLCSISLLLEFLKNSPFTSFYTLSNQGSAYAKFILYASRFFTKQSKYTSWATNTSDPSTCHLHGIISSVDHFLVKYLHTRCSSMGFPKFLDTPGILDSVITILEHLSSSNSFFCIISQTIKIQEQLLKTVTDRGLQLSKITSWNDISEWISSTEFPSVPALIIQITKIIISHKMLHSIELLFPVLINVVNDELKCRIFLLFGCLIVHSTDNVQNIVQRILDQMLEKKVYYNGCKIPDVLRQNIKDLLLNILYKYPNDDIARLVCEMDSTIFTAEHILKLSNTIPNTLMNLITGEIVHDLVSIIQNKGYLEHFGVWKTLVKCDCQLDFIHSVLLSKTENSEQYVELLLELYTRHPNLYNDTGPFNDLVANLLTGPRFNIQFTDLSRIPTYIHQRSNRMLLLDHIRNNIDMSTIANNPSIIYCLCCLLPDSQGILGSCLDVMDNLKSKIILSTHCNLIFDTMSKDILMKTIIYIIHEKVFFDFSGFLSIQPISFRTCFNNAIIDMITNHDHALEMAVNVINRVPFEYIQEETWQSLFETLLCISNDSLDSQVLEHLCNVSSMDRYRLLSHCMYTPRYIISQWLIVVLERRSISFGQMNSICELLKKSRTDLENWVRNVLETATLTHAGLLCIVFNLFKEPGQFSHRTLDEAFIKGLIYMKTDRFLDDVVFYSSFLKAFRQRSCDGTVIRDAILVPFREVFESLYSRIDFISISWIAFLCDCGSLIFKDSEMLTSVQMVILKRLIIMNDRAKSLIEAWILMNHGHQTMRCILDIKSVPDSGLPFFLFLLTNALVCIDGVDHINSCISLITRVLLRLYSYSEDINTSTSSTIKMLHNWIISNKIDNVELMFSLLKCMTKLSPMESGPILLDIQRQYFKKLLQVPGLWTVYIHVLLSLNWIRDTNSMNMFKRLCVQMIKNGKMNSHWKSLIKRDSTYLIAWCVWKLLGRDNESDMNRNSDALEYCIKYLGCFCKDHKNSTNSDWINLQLYDPSARALMEHLLGLAKQKSESLNEKKEIVFLGARHKSKKNKVAH